MNNRAANDENLLIDRLVDGELSSDERRQLLSDLEGQPDGWRRCALAFVEAQVLRSNLRQLMTSNSATVASQGVYPPGPGAQDSPSLKFPRVAWLAIAAALMLAFGLGRHLGSSNQSVLANLQNDGAKLADVAETSKKLPPVVQPKPLSTGDAVTLVVNNHEGVPQRVRVPLVEGRHLGQQFADTPEWFSSPELARQLNERGLDLAARRRYAPMFFEQANQLVPMIVPVDDAVVTPVNRPVY
jgi:hypothetical protein